MRCGVPFCREESRLSEKKLFEDWRDEDGVGPCESVRRRSRWHLAHRKGEV